MEHFEDGTFWIVASAIVILGFVATIVYYFARYYFRTHEQDKEVVPQLKEEPKESPPEYWQEPPSKEPVEVVPAPPAREEPQLKPIDLHEALKNTKQSFWGRIKDSLSARPTMGDDEMEMLEEVLYTSDLGPQTVQSLVAAVGKSLDSDQKSNVETVRRALKDRMIEIFARLENAEQPILDRVRSYDPPVVLMIVGVNGVGKTTTIGKLAHLFGSHQLKTMVVAGDTFRAAAREQLGVWSQRANVEIFDPGNVQDPSAVAFDGCTSAKAKSFDVVIVDTAGRLHTQDNLMDELKKMKRVMQKVLPQAPHEVLIVLDANSGQNALMQAKTFHEALDLTGVVLTKLDGTAKGGVAVGLAHDLELPIRLIGVGEGLEDLRNFDSQEFVDSII